MKTLWMQADAIESSSAQLQTDSALMVMPCTHPQQAQRAMTLAARRAGANTQDCLLVAVHDSQRMGFIAVVNRVFAHAQCRWMGYMAQDAFAGRDWLALALQTLSAAPQRKLLAFNDGKWHGQLAAFGLADSPWARLNYGGDFFFAGYHSHYADVELTLLARQQSALAYQPESVLIEADWDKDLTPVNAADRRMFQTRQKQGFGARVSQPELLELFS